MEKRLREIVDDQKNQSQPRESEEISTHDEGKVEDSILDPWWHVFLLDLLKVKLGKDVEPVRDLNDEEELEEEGHIVVRVGLPDGGHIQEVLPKDEVSTPKERNQVKGQKLSRFIELVVFHFAEMEFLVDLVKEIFLDDSMHHHGDQKVKEDGWDVL